ncbi:uncharacterized protein LOC143909321 isoform X2 [Arctopsyche grandis]|uniref:uncharacterized protein LOC143909321 isoform X2 n=1 Tax=Arctopsyche grandis TaxID=121162 RepID=UPI00406D87E1
MTSVAARRNGRGAAPDYSDSTDDSRDHSDNEGQEGDSEYGSVEHSGSEMSDRESGDAQGEGQKADDASNQGSVKPQVVDHDEDRRNPQYIPKRGTFYEHDDRTAPGAEDDGVASLEDGIASIDSSRVDRSVVSIGEVDERVTTPTTPAERRKTPKSNADRWLHDKYNENDQAPKSSDELIAIYGYDIRGEEGPPKAFRRHRYGRGPNKYTRNWEDENAYGKGAAVRSPKPPPVVTNGKEFPALQPKNDRNRINKRKPERKVHVVDNKVALDMSVTDKISHTNKVFTNKTNKIEKDVQEKPTLEELPRWKRGPSKVEPRKPAIVVKNQTLQQEQIKWPEPPRLSSPPKPLPMMSAQVQSSPPAMVPLQENKLPSARKLNQSQVPPRLQAIAPAQSAAAATSPASTVPAADASTRGKRYSSLRQRPMPDTYQPHQQQYITDYQQTPVPKQPTNQQTIPSMTTLPHRQTPPLLQSATQHHPSIQQLHQQAPQQLHQPAAQIHQQQATQGIHQQSAQLLQQSGQIHQQGAQMLQQTAQIHQQTPQIHQQTPQIHQQTPQIHQQSTQIHQQAAQMHQQPAQIHQQPAQIHQQPAQIHQQTPPPPLPQPQPHHQTPPPAHQSLNRQQANIPMRQVPRTHQQQMTLHSINNPAHLQAGLVTTQSYATPQMLPPQGQYIQNANGTVYGHVVPQVYAAPPPQAYATPQHQPIPPQAMPPQPLPPQAMPPQAIPPQALQPHTYHHQTPAPQHPSPYVPHVNTGRTVFREPSGITYYSPQEQKGAAPPTRRPTNAIPIVPPPPKERGKLGEGVPPPSDNIDHIVDNMFVPRQGRTGPSRPGMHDYTHTSVVGSHGETPPRSLEPTMMRQMEDAARQLEEKYIEEKAMKEITPEAAPSRLDLSAQMVEAPPQPI